MVTHVAVDSIWNCISYRVVYLAAFVSIADMPQQDVIVITARKVTTKIPPRQLVIVKSANVSLASRQLAPHDIPCYFTPAQAWRENEYKKKLINDPHFVQFCDARHSIAHREQGSGDRYDFFLPLFLHNFFLKQNQNSVSQ